MQCPKEDKEDVMSHVLIPPCPEGETSFSDRLKEQEDLVQRQTKALDDYTNGLMSQMKLGHQPQCPNMCPRKKYSHPGIAVPTTTTSSPPRTPRLNPRKKISLPGLNLPVPSVMSPFENDVTKSLESAVRKMSRGSSPLMGTSPNNRVAGTGIFIGGAGEQYSGLTGLAKGYEQYRESLLTLHPATEFGEPSSDDLSSEWESGNETEQANVVLKDAVTSNLIDNYQRRRKLMMSQQQQHQQMPSHQKKQASQPFESSHKTSAGNSKDDDDDDDPAVVHRTKTTIKRPSGWRKVRNMVQWTPFIQTFKNRKYQWVQLAGHSGNFKAGRSQGTVLKKLCPQEESCYVQFANDSLQPYVPEFQGTLVLDNEEKFIQLQDCLSSFVKPSIMDCKIGVRTYLEEELAKAKEKPKLRKDMYEKMIAVDPLAPTEEEKRLKGVTKPRYMVWRETISSTATLGFRIEGVKKSDGTSSKEFKTTKTRDQVMDSLSDFISASSITANQYLERLHAIRRALSTSVFFKTHELIGSSLLFVHDSEKACVWLIDFGKTVPLPAGMNIDHKTPWVVGNHEDGYLIGIDNLINIFTGLVAKLESSSASSKTKLMEEEPN